MAGDDSHVDVLIVGAGPAGLMAATWMARLGVKTRIVDKRGTKIFNGQADGLQCRSLEIFDSFGFADRVYKEANHMLEFCMWNPGEDGVIRRSDRMPDTKPGMSRFHEVVLHQGRIERFFLDHMRKYSKIEVERGVMPESLHYDQTQVDDNDAYPITVQLRHLTEQEATPAQNLTSIPDGLFRSSLAEDDTDDLIRKSQRNEGEVETVKAKYMIGCDGAHSWIRRQLGYQLEGKMTDFIWGVLAPDASGRADRSKISPESIIKAAQRILAPYNITYQYCDWWTAYQIGQRVGERFSRDERIFLAGDAVHTHSPKAGQGMNVSMHDTFNLGWKLGLVVKGLSPRSILKTYEFERKKIAHELIDFDHKFSRLFSGRPAKDILDETGVSMAVFKDTFEKAAFFLAGISVEYDRSTLVAKPPAEHPTNGQNGTGDSIRQAAVVAKQELAPGAPLGKRIPSYKVLNQSDTGPWHLAQLLRADGRFRIILFAGNIRSSEQKARLEKFVKRLDAADGPIHRVTPSDASPHSVIQVLTIHSAPRTSVDIFDFPDFLRPFDPQRGWDYDSIFVDDESFHEGHGEAYKNYGIDREAGCVIITRPDQHVAYVGSLDDFDDVKRYFEDVLQPIEMQREDAVTRRKQIPIANGDVKGDLKKVQEMVRPMNEVVESAL
ncbi:MAG: hypothetical protein Q9159_002507 [Coniocarpon cinnabarinum]